MFPSCKSKQSNWCGCFPVRPRVGARGRPQGLPQTTKTKKAVEEKSPTAEKLGMVRLS